jgi:hypothetical protein
MSSEYLKIRKVEFTMLFPTLQQAISVHMEVSIQDYYEVYVAAVSN